jgi:hypothetical protein
MVGQSPCSTLARRSSASRLPVRTWPTPL